MAIVEDILSSVKSGMPSPNEFLGGAFEAGKAGYNMGLEKAKYRNDMQAQQITWAREDNAVQRRAADLKAAGLNPILAAGQAASSGPVVSTTAPKMEGANPAVVALNLLSMRKNIAQTDAQTALIEQQAKNAAVDTATKLNDLDKARQVGGSVHGSSVVGSILKDLRGLSENAVTRVKNTVNKGAQIFNRESTPVYKAPAASQYRKAFTIPDYYTPKRR